MTAPLAMLALLAPAPGNSAFGSLFMIAAFFAIFYFLLIAPQQKQRKKHEELVLNIKRGDEVVTAGGIVGEVVHIKETMKEGKAERTMEDRVTIRSGESKLVIERGRIARVASSITASAAAE